MVPNQSSNFASFLTKASETVDTYQSGGPGPSRKVWFNLLAFVAQWTNPFL